ncbi:MAG: DUF2612 domain-containing protein [Caulobacteraceae bacterium]
MRDYTATLLSQYANSPVLSALVDDLNTWIDPTADINQFFSNYWNIDTAVGPGLDVWGRIVGVGRVLQVATTTSFGFSGPDGSSGVGFDQAPFYAGGTTTSNYALTDDAYRMLILAKALANISQTTIPAINQILLSLFPGRGDCYVTDGQNMTMTYHFTFALTPVEYAIVATSGVLPRPTGVSATVVQPS